MPLPLGSVQLLIPFAPAIHIEVEDPREASTS
jgi:hypothetical protein